MEIRRRLRIRIISIGVHKNINEKKQTNFNEYFMYHSSCTGTKIKKNEKSSSFFPVHKLNLHHHFSISSIKNSYTVHFFPAA